MKNKTNIKTLIGIIVLFIIFGVYPVQAYNYETSEFRLYSIKDGYKLCVKSDVLKNQGAYNMYAWSTFNSNHELAGWPGVGMTNTGNDIYCYTHTADGERYDYVIFNGNSKQTIDLNTINDTKGVINSLLYNFEESDLQGDGKYRGKWVVNDTTALENMVTEAKGLNANDYTINTYNSVTAALGDAVTASSVTNENKDQYNLGADYISQLTFDTDIVDKLTLVYDNGTNKYSSEYLTKYNQLATAMNNLIKRKDIVVNNNTNGGTLNASYKTNSDTSITINAQANTGYELESLTVKKITSYDGSNNPVFGESTNIDISSNNYEYSFDASEYSSNNMVGVYVDATFKKKTYQITFVVGANGKIKTLTDGNIASPVTVEYNDDYSLKVIANEGYEVDEILINGIKYNLNNGVLIIPNVVANTNVNITFKLKSYTIKVNDTEYTFSHGTTYEQMLQGLNLAKPGYKFLYLTDNSGSKITESYIVTKNDNLTAIYQKVEEHPSANEDTKENETPASTSKDNNKNPSTGDNIVKYVLMFAVTTIVLLLMFFRNNIKMLFVKRNN